MDRVTYEQKDGGVNIRFDGQMMAHVDDNGFYHPLNVSQVRQEDRLRLMIATGKHALTLL